MLNLDLPEIQNFFTVNEYLGLDRASEERHVYLDGVVYLMPSESEVHSEITMNLTGFLYNQLRGTTCRVRTKGTVVSSGPKSKSGRDTTGMFTYPDILVLCGEPVFYDNFKDIIVNPKVIIEGLSPITETFDRGEKWARYQKWNPTLTDYLLVSQDKSQVEHYARQQDGVWSFRRAIGLDAIVEIPSIGCTLRLADIYDGVRFEMKQDDNVTPT